MRQFAARHDELAARGVLSVRVFHSPAAALSDLAVGPAAVPQEVLADPERRAYRAWGVASSPLAVLDPRAWRRARAAAARGHRPRWRDTLRDGIGVVPADFLVDSGGRLERVRYGRHFTDSLGVDEALAWLAGEPADSVGDRGARAGTDSGR